MNTIERVLHFLKKHVDQAYCDECLALELRVRSSLSRMLDVLSDEYFRRGKLTCSQCGECKPGIVQVREHKDGPIGFSS